LSPLGNYTLGIFFLKNLDTPKALQYLIMANRQAPRDIDISLLLAQVYLMQQKYNTAYNLLRPFSSLKARSDIAITRAYALMKQNKFSKAQKQLNNIGVFLKSEDDIAARFLEIIDQTLDSKQDRKS
jgi:predicted Zn-dependent protease